MNRKERRAAEHAARKSDRKAGFPTIVKAEEPVIAPAPPPSAAAEPTVSEAQLAANRANAQKSTGPKTEAGKSKVSHNAVTNALTGLTILLPTDDVAAYEELGQVFINRHKPVGPEEKQLVQSLIDAQWRLRRIPSLEAAVFAVGRQELAGTVPPELLEGAVYLKFERNLKNLGLQETRIRRNQEKDLARLQELQADRHQQEAIRRKIQEIAAKQKQQSPPANQEPKNGFVFETSQNPATEPRLSTGR